MKKELTSQERADALQEFDYDLWINLLNHGSYEDIGKEVVQMLMKAKTNKLTLSRNILICGS